MVYSRVRAVLFPAVRKDKVRTRCIYIAMNVKSRYQSLIATGCVTIFAFHVLTNIAMVVGLLPIAGVPLPFLSYGGSFLLTSLILCGLLMNVWRNRFDY